jgi:hypothetical protein
MPTGFAVAVSALQDRHDEIAAALSGHTFYLELR